MTRNEMLSALGKLEFAFIWPGSWEDVGFTEREIWVNSKGYGYIMCDEPNQRWEGPGLGRERWQIVKDKIKNETLVYEDIKGTSLEDLLDTFGVIDDFEDQEQLCIELSDLALTDYPEHYFYAYESNDGIQYFDSEKAYKAAMERDWADEYWENMDDELLADWIDRLSIEENPSLEKWTQGLNLDPDICEEDENAEIQETEKNDGFWTANNTKYFKFQRSTMVYEGNKKRYVYLTAEGKDIKNPRTEQLIFVTRTEFNVISSRNNTVVHCVVAGMPELGSTITDDNELGKWASIKDKLYQELLKMIGNVAGKDFNARSNDLLIGLKNATNTNILDGLIQGSK